MAYKRSYASTKSNQQDQSVETIINLDAKKRVTVRKFNNVNLVDIREFYTDANGEQKPGKKGISLTEDTYYKLIEAHNKIQHALDALNGGGAAQKRAKVEKSDKIGGDKVESAAKKNSDGVKKEGVKQEQAVVSGDAGSAGGEENDTGGVDTAGAAAVAEDNNNQDGDFAPNNDKKEEEEEVSDADE
ncbi:hypothetical protein CANMA_000407 [Candida margitis]|uniref:uncharacterized protein n=1 Tax=Candida margitis TaxID=1775924 RepID=UPI002227335F|nr:uncharacterized protein CANMA_000407 [Candida margitis]KAI5970498.1 hypothetical protein CANMA_000407 [Candida margitis]